MDAAAPASPGRADAHLGRLLTLALESVRISGAISGARSQADRAPASRGAACSVR